MGIPNMFDIGPGVYHPPRKFLLEHVACEDVLESPGARKYRIPRQRVPMKDGVLGVEGADRCRGKGPVRRHSILPPCRRNPANRVDIGIPVPEPRLHQWSHLRSGGHSHRSRREQFDREAAMPKFGKPKMKQRIENRFMTCDRIDHHIPTHQNIPTPPHPGCGILSSSTIATTSAPALQAQSKPRFRRQAVRQPKRAEYSGARNSCSPQLRKVQPRSAYPSADVLVSATTTRCQSGRSENRLSASVGLLIVVVTITRFILVVLNEFMSSVDHKRSSKFKTPSPSGLPADNFWNHLTPGSTHGVRTKR